MKFNSYMVEFKHKDFSFTGNLLINDKSVSVNFKKAAKDLFIAYFKNQLELKFLEKIKFKNEESVDIVSYTKNVGKAEAVRRGMQWCNRKYDHLYIAYLDADLSTPLQECIRLRKYLNEKIEFCFGSRIMRIGSVIERKFYRFLIGRCIATFISNILDLKVYDTQCGCKIFTKNLSILLFENEFISKWLFDVELFFRIIELYGRNQVLEKMIEVPVNKWIDSGTSKVKVTYFFRLWLDLYRIRKAYKKT